MCVAVAASACASIPMPPPASPAPRVEEVAPAELAAPAPQPSQAVAPEPPAMAAVEPMTMTTPANLPAPTDAQTLRERYGPPDFVRRETDSELWRYDAGACAIFFFLYREGAALKIRYSQTSPPGTDMAADPGCVQRLSARAMS
jgi:hypothetical protein